MENASEQQIREIVHNGAALLDQERPGWEWEIDLSCLKLWLPSMCILGQLYGDYEDGLNVLDIWGTAQEYGFCAAQDEEGNVLVDCCDLQPIWEEVIRHRQKVSYVPHHDPAGA